MNRTLKTPLPLLALVMLSTEASRISAAAYHFLYSRRIGRRARHVGLDKRFMYFRYKQGHDARGPSADSAGGGAGVR